MSNHKKSESIDNLELKLIEHLALMKDKERELAEIEQNDKLDIDTKILLMMKILNEGKN